jgi:hypothetical protein
VTILDTKLLFVLAMLFLGFLRFAAGLKGAYIPAAVATESDKELFPEAFEEILPESVAVGCFGAVADTMQAWVPAVTGREAVPIGLGCTIRGSEGCGGGMLRVNSSRKV